MYLYRSVAPVALALVASLLWSGRAQAALVTVLEVVTRGGTVIASATNFTGGEPRWVEFDIPGFDGDLRMRGRDSNNSGASEGDVNAGGIPCNANGCGLKSGNGDSSNQVDNDGRTDALEFTIPSRPGFQFRLVGIEFTQVNSDDDSAMVIVDQGKHDAGDTPAVVLDPIDTSSVCDDRSDGKCRIGLVEGLDAFDGSGSTVIKTNSGTGTTNLEVFDYYHELDPDLFFGEWFVVSSLFAENDDSWRIKKIYWEIAISDVPAPGTLSLLALGLIGLGGPRIAGARPRRAKPDPDCDRGRPVRAALSSCHATRAARPAPLLPCPVAWC
ncbi:MAG: hypothetical protein RIM84_17090 [Alphaproteobacteria bacterium]